jgi:nitrogen-specific signal transduction histidine kinase
LLYRLTPYEKIEEEFKRAIELASISKTVVTLHHEINSPLTAILGSAALLKDKELSQETIKKLSTMIYEQTKAISLIIKKLNNITKPVTSEYAPGSGIEMLEI